MERFPYTLPVVAVISFGAIVATFISLGSDVNALVAQKANVLGTMFLTGLTLSIVTPIALYRGKFAEALAPKLQFELFNFKQAAVTIAGFFTLGVFQYTVNKITLSSFLLSVGPTTQLSFKIGSAIAEELFFSAWLCAMIYSVVRQSVHPAVASLVSTLMTALAFVYYHSFVYGTDPVALTFVFGARIVIALVFLYTHSLFAAMFIHILWNVLS